LDNQKGYKGVLCLLLIKTDERGKMEKKEGNEKLIEGIKFKLQVEPEVSEKLNDYFEEYGTAVNYTLQVIQKELENDRFAGKIKLDLNNKPILDENKKKIWVFPNENCSCGEQVRRYVNNKPFCQKCYNMRFTEYGIRKRMCSVKNRKAEPAINIKNATNKISGSHFHSAIREAIQQYKSVQQQKRKKYQKLFKDKLRLQEFIEMREGKRIELPLKKGQRAKRYLHLNLEKKYELTPEKFYGYTRSKIESKIEIMYRNIQHDEKSLSNKNIQFRARRIILTKIRKIDFKKVVITISSSLPKEYNLILPKKEKNLKWFTEKLELLQHQENNYPYLLRKQNKHGETDFYLQTTIKTPKDIKNDYSGALGIDRGINHLAVCTFVSNGLKSGMPIFFSSSDILNLKGAQKRRDKILRYKHNKIRKKGNMRRIENRINLILHEYSKEIVALALEKKAYIVFEKLEKIKKSRMKMPKSLRYALSLFLFQKLSQLVEYKANREGIKVEYVSPEYTSRDCSRCGSTDTQRPYQGNYNLFKCNKCGTQLNADYNASVNIAKKSL
jgi:IS605 OrfB family transposase